MIRSAYGKYFTGIPRIFCPTQEVANSQRGQGCPAHMWFLIDGPRFFEPPAGGSVHRFLGHGLDGPADRGPGQVTEAPTPGQRTNAPETAAQR